MIKFISSTNFLNLLSLIFGFVAAADWFFKKKFTLRDAVLLILSILSFIGAYNHKEPESKIVTVTKDSLVIVPIDKPVIKYIDSSSYKGIPNLSLFNPDGLKIKKLSNDTLYFEMELINVSKEEACNVEVRYNTILYKNKGFFKPIEGYSTLTKHDNIAATTSEVFSGHVWAKNISTSSNNDTLFINFNYSYSNFYGKNKRNKNTWVYWLFSTGKWIEMPYEKVNRLNDLINSK